MQQSYIGIGLDIGLALLLAVVLFFCWRLERKLSALRSGQDGIRAAAVELKEATAHAEIAVRALRATALETGRDLQARIDDAKSVADGLGINISRARPQARAGGRW